MAVETQVAIIGAIAMILTALVPLLIQSLRKKGFEVSEAQEYLIRDAVREGALFAEELARKSKTDGPGMTGAEKLVAASRHAQIILDQYKVRVRQDSLAARVESHLHDLPSRKSIP